MDTTYVKSVKNLRDLGGMKTRDGHRTEIVMGLVEYLLGVDEKTIAHLV